ncbi:YajG family lipoprotein [Halomonas organivorans]|uniref:Putative lipoprotein n=1 Tax=Halomonas organivorans TaxID=257772 RepID=A0A7W5C263_9GAMM|nr:YajG family lipoprotein [Halomonas organivorans]MBB3143472.1 putative lipoprotein [Halomonas organivorans]
MTTRRLLGLGILLLATSWLAGCAGPHYLQPDPKRSAKVPAVGTGQEVSVTARDTREEAVIGTRSGSAGSTAVIIVDPGELAPRLQAEAERAVRDMGFRPTRDSAPGRPNLTLTLKRLDYGRGDAPPLVGSASLVAVMEAEARNDGTTYTGTYTARHTQQYAVRPDREANQAMVEELLSDALDRAFRDPELASLLAR